jgi:lysyl-tRNA synthetase class 2
VTDATTSAAATVRPWQPGAGTDTLRARARLLAALRAFFQQRDVLEVETPVLSHAGGTDPALAPLVTTVGAQPMYLQTSPEFAMKRLLAAGSGDIFQIARVFRDDEVGRHHNPEFTMLEWYRCGFDHHALMDEVAALLARVLPADRFPSPARRVTFHEVLAQSADIDSAEPTAPTLRRRLSAAGVSIPEGADGDTEALLDLLLGEVVGPALGHDGPLMVYDYPASRASLAIVRGGSPPVAERFEVYVSGIELANGFHELRDPQEQRARFEAEQAVRRAAGRREVPLDEALLAALEHGLPGCAGVALGVDRLLMCMLGAEHLSDVLAFDYARA